MRDGNDLHTTFSDAENSLLLGGAPNANDYLEYLQDDDYDNLSDAEKVELLECLLTIMKSFVNLGYGLDPVNKLIEEFETSGAEPIPVIESEDATDEE